jgi:hypothetical protein
MSKSKLKFSNENINLSCKGDKEWVASLFTNLLDRIPSMNTNPATVPVNLADAKVIPVHRTYTKKIKSISQPILAKTKKAIPDPLPSVLTDGPLLDFLKEKNAVENHVRRLLGTAVFLHSQGIERFTSPMITAAVTKIGFPRFSNITESIIRNASKELCIRDGKEFVLTDKGIHSILTTQSEMA